MTTLRQPARLFRATLMFAATALVAGATLTGARAADTDYPTKPIKIIVPFPAGSGTDTSARRIAQMIQEATGQAAVVENKPGASGFIAAQAAATSPPDGYTLFVTTNTTHAANASLFKKLPYDPIKDFAPISRIAIAGLVLVVAPDSPIKTVSDLVKLAKEKPGKITFASGSSSTRIAGEMLASRGSVQMLHIPYKGVPQALTDVMGHQVDFMISDVTPATPLIAAGKLRAIAVTLEKRHFNMPDVPTIGETFPGYSMFAWSAAFAPTGTPRPIIDKLAALIKAGVETPAMQENFKTTGGEGAPMSPDELGKFVVSETEKWAKAVKEAGIEPE
jgi:tripartite-type tricarboxylate transporter receptor subunit TctC